MIIVIIGPTAVGKTKLSVELAKIYNAEIINGDAMQVYKEMDIATAKIKEEEKEGIVHHLFDICDYTDNYTVYDYQRDARFKIEDIMSRGRNVIIVGGTGLYIKAALYDYRFKEEETRRKYDHLSDEDLYQMVKKIDKSIDIHMNNRRRLERFLEKCDNDSITENCGDTKLYDFFTIGLTTNRDLLYEKINNRVDLMIKDGLLEEARKFYDRGVSSKALKTGIGYKELFEYFDGKVTLDQALYNIKKNSRHYAKRQYTFFNNKFDVTWFDTDYDDFNKTVLSVEDFIDSNISFDSSIDL